MIRTHIKLDDQLEGKMATARKDVAKAMISIVLDEFNHMLKGAPQRYGNFVANFSIAPGLRAGRVPAKLYFPTNTDENSWFARGNLPAIQVAQSNVSNLTSRMTAHVTKSSGWMSGMTVYNRLDYAEKVEGYSEFTLRAENKGGSHPLAKMEARLAARSKKKVVYGSPEFEALVRRAGDV